MVAANSASVRIGRQDGADDDDGGVERDLDHRRPVVGDDQRHVAGAEAQEAGEGDGGDREGQPAEGEGDRLGERRAPTAARASR